MTEAKGCLNKDGSLRLCSECGLYAHCWQYCRDDLFTMPEAIMRMDEPKEFLKDDVVSLIVDFINNDNFYDQTFFDVDCSKDTWRTEFLDLWNEFREDENLPENCVVETWATYTDDPDLFI